MLLVLGPKTTHEDRRVHERAGAADVDAVAELFDQVHDDVERALVPLLVGLAEREELLLRVVVDFVRRQHLRPSLAELHWAWDVPLLRRLLDVAREVAPVDVVEVRLLVVGDQVGGWRVERLPWRWWWWRRPFPRWWWHRLFRFGLLGVRQRALRRGPRR